MLRALKANLRAAVRDALETHLGASLELRAQAFDDQPNHRENALKNLANPASSAISLSCSLELRTMRLIRRGRLAPVCLLAGDLDQDFREF